VVLPSPATADDFRIRPQEWQCLTTGSRAFTSINMPPRQLQQLTRQAYNVELSPDSHDTSHSRFIANSCAADYLKYGDITDDARFGRRAAVPTRTKSDEEFYDNAASSLETLKKRAYTAASKRAKKTKTLSKSSVAHGMRVTKPKGNASKKTSDIKPNPRVDISDTIKDDALSQTKTLFDQSVHEIGAWMSQPPLPLSSSSALSLSAFNSLDSVITNTSSGAPSHSVCTMANTPDSQKVYKLDDIYIHGMINIAQPVPGVRVLPLQPSRTTHRPSSMRGFLATIAEESVPLDNSIGDDLTLKPKFQPPIIKSSEMFSRSDCTAGKPTNLAYDLFDDANIDDVDDDKLLNLGLLKASDPSRSCNVSSTRPNSTTLPTRGHLDVLGPSPTFSPLADEYNEWDVLGDDEEIDILDLTDDMLQVIGLTPLSTAPTSTHLLASQYTLPVPTLRYTESTALFSDPLGSPEIYAQEVLHRRIVRPPFMQPIHDRSPIVGISATTRLRTCFRIGEALNTSFSAVRNSSQAASTSILIELYAKVSSSQREESGVRHHFTFADLFHEEKPPFITGICECWKGSELWEYDCRRFLGSGIGGQKKKLCRVIASMKREGKEWSLVVLNIWEATWNDVEYARMLVCGQ
jgi:hypothetical protein